MSDPKIPNIPSSVPSDQVPFFTALKSCLELLAGHGRNLDNTRAVRVEELTKLGINLLGFLNSTAKKPYAVISSSSASSKAPEPPRGLSVVKGAFVHTLIWTNPLDPIVSHIEIWIAEDSQDREDAWLDGIFTVTENIRGGDGIYKHSGFDVTRDHTYWIRSISYAGNHSEWHPSDILGGYVVAGDDSVAETISRVLAILQGQITENELYADLNTRIDLIDTPSTGIFDRLADAQAKIDTSGTGLLDRVSSITNQLDATGTGVLDRLATLESDLGSIPAFDDSLTYAVDDTVIYSDKIYVCIQAITTTPAPLPTNTTYWEQIGESASLAGNIAANATAISDLDVRVTDNEDDISSQATSISSLQATISNGTTGLAAAHAAITSEETARASADSALSTSISGLSAQVNHASTGLPAAHSAIASEASARVSADSAIASDVSVLDAQVNHATTGLPAAHAAVVSEATARTDADSALASDISTLDAQVNHSTTGLPAAHAAVASESTARANADSAIASDVSGLTATINNETTGLAAAHAAVASEATARANADGAIASDLSVLDAQVNNATTGLPASHSRITAEAVARADADEALASDITAGIAEAKLYTDDAEFKLPSDENLVGHWTFDDGSGTVAADSSGNENHGTIVGTPAWANGVSGKALACNAVCHSNIPLGVINQNEGSWSCWAKVNSSAGGVRIFASKATPSGLYGDFRTYTVDGSYLNFIVGNGTVAKPVEFTDQSILTGEYIFLLFTWEYDGSADTELKAYVNGELTNATSMSGQIYVPDININIGSWNGTNRLDGDVDEFRIYNKPLTAQEVKALYVLPGGTTPTNSAQFIHEQTARADADTAIATDLSGLTATVTNPTTGLAAAHSAVVSEQTARAEADLTIAGDVSQLSTTVEGNTTSIETQATTINGIQGKYAVKIDNNGYVTGFGLISTDNDGEPTSEFIILADSFKIITPGGTPKVPFVVGQVDGVSTVGIDGNLVVDDTILARMIQADAIKASHIDANEVFVGLTIQSSNYVEGVSGWQIHKDGVLTISGSGGSIPWGTVSGEGRPANGATVGATWGVNIDGDNLPADNADVTADQILVTNPNFEQGLDYWIGTGAVNGVVVSSVGISGGNVIELDQASVLITEAYIPVDITKTYTVRYNVRQTVDTAVQTDAKIYLGVVMYKADKTYNEPHAFPIQNTAGLLASDGWQTLKAKIGPGESSNFTTGTAYIKLHGYVNWNGTDGTAQIDKIDILEDIAATNGVADGATNDSDIRHASDITTIDGGKIYTGSVTAEAINVTGGLSALSANLGTVTAGIAKSIDNKFQIDLTNKNLKVYDAAGVLRVHLGYIP